MEGEAIWRAIFLVLFLIVAIYCSLLARRVARLEEQVRRLGGGSPGDRR